MYFFKFREFKIYRVILIGKFLSRLGNIMFWKISVHEVGIFRTTFSVSPLFQSAVKLSKLKHIARQGAHFSQWLIKKSKLRRTGTDDVIYLLFLWVLVSCFMLRPFIRRGMDLVPFRQIPEWPSQADWSLWKR